MRPETNTFVEWYDGFTSAEAQGKFRERALQTIAAATCQLYKFQYSQAGAPSFDEEGRLQAIEPVRVLDVPAMHDRMFSDSTDEDHIFCEVGPFNNAKDYFHSMLDKHRRPKHAMGEGYHKLLRLFINWIPDKTPIHNEQFVLAHPDLNLQNLLVAEDGTLSGLIDWEGVSTVPPSVGCSFPQWLTFDWDTENYNHGQDIDCECENRHHSPDEMKHYRALYAHFVHQAASENEVGSQEFAFHLADTTCKSILIDNIYRAAKNAFSTFHIVSDIVDKIAHVTCQDYFKAFCDLYEGNAEAIRSTKAIEPNDQNQHFAHSEDGSSSDESNSSIDSVFSKASRASQDSTECSDPPSEPDKQQAIEPNCGFPELTDMISRVRSSATPDTSALLEENCTTSFKEEKRWRRVSSLVQKASRHMQAKVRRFQATKTEHNEIDGSSIVRDGIQSITANTKSASSACGSSKEQEIIQPEHLTTTAAHAIEDQSFGRHGCAVSNTHKSKKENADAVHTTGSYTRSLGHLIDDKDANQCIESPSSSGQPQDLPGSLHVHSKRGSDASPTNSLKPNLGRRLRAKLALNQGRKASVVRASSPALSAESGGSRRKRILAWIRKTGQKPLSDEQKSESSWDSDSTSPEIPEVSQLHMSQPDEAGTKTDTNTEEVHDTAAEDAINIAKLAVAGAANIPSYDAGEPVADGRLCKEGFLTADICEDLAHGTFDEARMRRMRLGFAALLSSLQFSGKSSSCTISITI